MSEKRARNQAKRKARKNAARDVARVLRERDLLEARRAGAHGLSPWSGPERQRKAKRLLSRAQAALRDAGVRTRGERLREERGDLVVLPSKGEAKAIDDALRRREEEVQDDG